MFTNEYIILGNAEGSECDASRLSAKDVQIELQAPLVFLFDTYWRNQISELDGEKIFFLATHGGFGEDGTLQKFLEQRESRHTHSSSGASAKMTNKHQMKLHYLNLGIRTPVWKYNNYGNEIETKKYPSWVAKPIDGGSKKGLILLNSNKLYDSQTTIFEVFIPGSYEVSVWTIGREDPLVLPPLLRRRSKRNLGLLEDCNFAPSIKAIKTCSNWSKLVHRSLGACGIIKTDYLLDNDNEPFAIETDAHPALHIESGAAKQAMKTGMSYKKLIRFIGEHHG